MGRSWTCGHDVSMPNVSDVQCNDPADKDECRTLWVVLCMFFLAISRSSPEPNVASERCRCSYTITIARTFVDVISLFAMTGHWYGQMRRFDSEPARSSLVLDGGVAFLRLARVKFGPESRSFARSTRYQPFCTFQESCPNTWYV